MAMLIDDNLLEQVLEVVELSNRRLNTVEGDEEESETEFTELNDMDNDNDNSSTACNINDDPLLETTTKSFQSMELNSNSNSNACNNNNTNNSNACNNNNNTEKDESLKSISILLPERSLQTQDSTQRLASVDYNAQEPQQRSRRRRRRSLKDSIASLFSSSSHHNKRESSCGIRKTKRTPSPRDPQRTSTPRSQRFSLPSLVLKRRSLHRRKKHGQRRFSALSLEFDLFHSSDKMDRRSAPLRQSSSTAFTSAALEVSQVFDREALAADLEEESEELSSPFGRQVVF